ncbi:MAG: hypothetical protein CO032_03120 [Nitrosopumilales archaeon CG_4_9_14_0_2_um_filter_34_16]|nr:MAG: hypothetical protein CO032_03120 [Nitrosopumilales archaeon CG_4_9_14_0_2_um_filter_34_16]
MLKDKIKIISQKGRILHDNNYDHQTVECPICNRDIVPYWESRYNGIRATCDVCGINWAES